MSTVRTFGALGAATMVLAMLGAANCSSAVCDFDSDCPADQFCAEKDGESFCGSACDVAEPCNEGEACVAVEGGGAACVPAAGGQLGEDCNENNDCATGACVFSGETSVCVLLCAEDGSCPDPAQCYPSELARVCLTPSDDRSPGEACDNPQQCASAICANQGSEGATCVAACTVTEDCEGGTLCADLLSGERGCLRGLDNGEACVNADLCKGGRCIADTDGERLCTNSCTDWLCEDGWSCVPAQTGDRVCMPNTDTKATGETCSSARDCDDPYCINFGDPYGVQCAPACEQDVLCAEPRICWEVDEQPNVCGPTG